MKPRDEHGRTGELPQAAPVTSRERDLADKRERGTATASELTELGELRLKRKKSRPCQK